MARQRKFTVTVLGKNVERGCPHPGFKPRSYIKCAACGEVLCGRCRRQTLLPNKFVCKNGCPEWAVEQIEKNFAGRYALALKKGGKA